MLKYSIEGDVLYSDSYMKLDENGMPDEEALNEAYQKAIDSASPRPLIVHIKAADSSDQQLHPQLRALLRASVHGKLRILFSVISCIEEMVAVKIALAEVQQDLTIEGVVFSEEIPLGIAIETPAAAVISHVLAQECDYFIIDTQNLIRHSLASNYTDQQIMEEETLYNPAILTLIKCAIDGAHQGGLTCGIWGEAAEDFRVIPALIGFGVNDLFVSKDRIVHIRDIIGRISGERCEKLAGSLLMAETRSEVMDQLESIGNLAAYSGKL